MSPKDSGLLQQAILLAAQENFKDEIQSLKKITQSNHTQHNDPIKRQRSRVHAVVCARRPRWGLEMGETNVITSVWLQQMEGNPPPPPVVGGESLVQYLR